MNEPEPVPDHHIRLQAETTFDRNIVVVAGAGTGKTTLLVNRLVNLLMKEPKPVAVTQLVALTFTNKAATEMKVRLRERLLALAQAETARLIGPDVSRQVSALRERYGLSSHDIAVRADAALQDLEKAQIGTLHSFAAHLLRLYPLESGVDPAFREDDGLRFDEHFTAQWDLWLDRELGQGGANHNRWRRLLAYLELDQVREMARSLCNELVDLDALRDQLAAAHLDPSLRDRLAAAQGRAVQILAAHDRPKRRKIESMLDAAGAVFRSLIDRGLDGLADLDADVRRELDRDLDTRVAAGWGEEEFEEASGLIGLAQQFRQVDQPFFRDMLSLLEPFVREVRRTFVADGWLSFDGLLARACRLLRDHPQVRERIKRDYRAVLVDEFQDTDPVQYEIILYVSERPGHRARSWQEIELEPGKLFIVGDPKQSIYAFRRADIEAFDRVVRKICDDGGEALSLRTNFRSHGSVLAVVNEVFDRLFQRREHLQPENVRLEVRPSRQAATTRTGVSLRLVKQADEEAAFDSETATRAEAEALARWLKNEVLDRETVVDEQGRRGPLKPGHVALLFRKLTQAEDYLEALRRHGIPYLTDGEKHFYRRQEVIDLVNLLRVLDNPHDAVALAGVLRSPLGGVTDAALYELCERQALDYRRSDRLAGWNNPAAAAVLRLYAGLAELHRAVPHLPLSDMVDAVFDRLPVLELAAASLHGEQAVANLAKVRQTAAALADRPHLTLSGFVELMVARLEDQPDEAESALAEESLDAVRVLTVHKAKGLEFPVVILPGLHQGAGPGGSAPCVAHDWSTGTYGLMVGAKRNLGAVPVYDKLRAREEAERRRVLYVGMTRAKDWLVLSGGITARAGRDNVLMLLREIAEGELGSAKTPALRVGTVSIPQHVIEPPERMRPRRPSSEPGAEPAMDFVAWATTWRHREERWRTLRATPRHLTPSAMRGDGLGPESVADRARADRDLGALIGVLAHRVLEGWDFTEDPARLDERIDAVCRAGIPPERQDEAAAVAGELREMFQTFVSSEPYAALRRATVLGREVPFAVKWTGEGRGARREGAGDGDVCVMHGVMDLVYRLDGRLWVADYKTDRVGIDEVRARAESYRDQARMYTEALSRSLREDHAQFQFIFLRHGIAVIV
ncbi:MAG TPA: UvrD-helicase domain-containing protein [Chloroflexota bacterium]|nr:UvrD-helicase domain-containing protein [Chloroflexota bacterium]